MSHWHKLGFQAFLAKEIMRKDTLPFAIGMGFVALMGLGLNASITEEDRKSSAYHKQFVLNDRKGDNYSLALRFLSFFPKTRSLHTKKPSMLCVCG